MAEIVSAVTRVTDIMGEIASASDEQSRGIDQVGLAVAEMDRVTQQNAALVEESAAAAAALEEQASRLTEAVAVFRIQQQQQQQQQQRETSAVVKTVTPTRRVKWPWQIARRTGKRFNVMMPDSISSGVFIIKPGTVKSPGYMSPALALTVEPPVGAGIV